MVFKLTKPYLLNLDHQVRAAVHSMRCTTIPSVIRQIHYWHNVNKQPTPPNELIIARMVRLIDFDTLEKIFRRSQVSMSFEQIMKWRNESINDILFEGVRQPFVNLLAPLLARS